MTSYYPKASRCEGCSKRHQDCSALPFHRMPVHRHDGGDAIVICTEYRQINHCASLRDRSALRQNRGVV